MSKSDAECKFSSVGIVINGLYNPLYIFIIYVGRYHPHVE